MATRMWGEHLADISRALGVIEKADRELNAVPEEGTAGHYSDLQFILPRRVEIQIDDVPTGWAIVWDEDQEGWVADFGNT